MIPKNEVFWIKTVKYGADNSESFSKTFTARLLIATISDFKWVWSFLEKKTKTQNKQK